MGTKTLAIRLEESELRQVEEYAEKDCRSVANMMRMMIKAYVSGQIPQGSDTQMDSGDIIITEENVEEIESKLINFVRDKDMYMCTAPIEMEKKLSALFPTYKKSFESLVISILNSLIDGTQRLVKADSVDNSESELADENARLKEEIAKFEVELKEAKMREKYLRSVKVSYGIDGRKCSGITTEDEKFTGCDMPCCSTFAIPIIQDYIIEESQHVKNFEYDRLASEIVNLGILCDIKADREKIEREFHESITP